MGSALKLIKENKKMQKKLFKSYQKALIGIGSGGIVALVVAMIYKKTRKTNDDAAQLRVSESGGSGTIPSNRNVSTFMLQQCSEGGAACNYTTHDLEAF